MRTPNNLQRFYLLIYFFNRHEIIIKQTNNARFLYIQPCSICKTKNITSTDDVFCVHTRQTLCTLHNPSLLLSLFFFLISIYVCACVLDQINWHSGCKCSMCVLLWRKKQNSCAHTHTHPSLANQKDKYSIKFVCMHSRIFFITHNTFYSCSYLLAYISL